MARMSHANTGLDLYQNIGETSGRGWRHWCCKRCSQKLECGLWTLKVWLPKLKPRGPCLCVFDYVQYSIHSPNTEYISFPCAASGLLLSFCFQHTSHFDLSEFTTGSWHGRELTEKQSFFGCITFHMKGSDRIHLFCKFQSDNQIVSVVMDVSPSVSPSDALLIRIVLNCIPNTLVPIQVVCCRLSCCRESKWSRWRSRCWLDHHLT